MLLISTFCACQQNKICDFFCQKGAIQFFASFTYLTFNFNFLKVWSIISIFKIFLKKRITAFQNEEVYCIQAGITFSNFCDVQTNLVEYVVGNILTVFSRFFFVLLSIRHIAITICPFRFAFSHLSKCGQLLQQKDRKKLYMKCVCKVFLDFPIQTCQANLYR